MPPNARPWFRFYSDILDNLKAEKLNDRQFRRWIKLLALANVNVPRGQLPSIEKIAFRLRINETTVKSILEELETMGFVDSKRGVFTMHDWREWQKDRDVTASKREPNVALTSRDSHANVTPHAPDRHAREEKSREEKKERRVEEEETRERDPLDDLASDFAKFGACNERTNDLITESVEHYGFEAVQSAVDKAAGSGKTDLPWNYIVSILEGKNDFANPRNGTHTAGGPATDDPTGILPRRRVRMD